MYAVWKLNTGGAERIVVNYHNFFKNNCEIIDVKTLCFSCSCGGVLEKEIDTSDSSVVYIPEFWGKRFPKLISKISTRLFYKEYRKKWFVKMVEDYSPNILHIHLANLAAELVDVCKKLPKNIKIIYHLHSMPETIGEKQRRKLKYAIQNKIYNPICVTNLQLESAIKYYNVPVNTPVVYNGINENLYSQIVIDDCEKSNLKKKFGISQNALVIGSVGRGAAIKNYPLIAKAAEILGQRQNVILCIAGEIPNDLKTEIRSIVKTANVVFVGQVADMGKLYKVMDVFVLASFYESSSIVTVEAQLSGIPCVISDRISKEVIISDGVIQLSPETSPDIWAKQILNSVGKEIHLCDRDRFDFNHSARRLLNIYESLMINNNCFSSGF